MKAEDETVERARAWAEAKAKDNAELTHTTVPYDNPASKSRRFATVCELRLLG